MGMSSRSWSRDNGAINKGFIKNFTTCLETGFEYSQDTCAQLPENAQVDSAQFQRTTTLRTHDLEHLRLLQTLVSPETSKISRDYQEKCITPLGSGLWEPEPPTAPNSLCRNKPFWPITNQEDKTLPKPSRFTFSQRESQPSSLFPDHNSPQARAPARVPAPSPRAHHQETRHRRPRPAGQPITTAMTLLEDPPAVSSCFRALSLPRALVLARVLVPSLLARPRECRPRRLRRDVLLRLVRGVSLLSWGMMGWLRGLGGSLGS